MPSSSRQRSITLASHTLHTKKLRMAIASSPVTSRRSSPGSISLAAIPTLHGRDLRRGTRTPRRGRCCGGSGGIAARSCARYACLAKRGSSTATTPAIVARCGSGGRRPARARARQPAGRPSTNASSPRCPRPRAPSRVQRFVGHRERDLVDHDEHARRAGRVDAGPERSGPDEHRRLVLDERPSSAGRRRGRPASSTSWSVRSRSTSANRCTFACDVHSTSARPPAALTSSHSRSARLRRSTRRARAPDRADPWRRRGSLASFQSNDDGVCTATYPRPAFEAQRPSSSSCSPHAPGAASASKSHLARERGERRLAAERRRHRDHRPPREQRRAPIVSPAATGAMRSRACAADPSRPTRRRRRRARRAGATPRAGRPRAAVRFAYSSPAVTSLPLAAASRSAARRQRLIELAIGADVRPCPSRARSPSPSARPASLNAASTACVGAGPREHPAQARERFGRRCRRANALVALSAKAWASSRITTSCSGSTRPSDARCAQYNAWFTTRIDASLRAVARALGEALVAVGAVRLARALDARARSPPPTRRRLDLDVELRAVAGLRALRELAEPLELAREARADRLLEQRVGRGRGPQLRRGTDSSTRPFKQREREANDPRAPASAGRSLPVELALQHDRRRRDDDPQARRDRGDEIRQALARTGRRLGEEMVPARRARRRPPR